MFYRLKNPKPFFKETRNGRPIYWFSCPKDLMTTEPYCHIKTDNELGLLMHFLLTLTSLKHGSNDAQWVPESTLKATRKGGKGLPYHDRMTHLVRVGVFEARENIDEFLTDNLRNSEFSANNTKEKNIKQTQKSASEKDQDSEQPNSQGAGANNRTYGGPIKPDHEQKYFSSFINIYPNKTDIARCSNRIDELVPKESLQQFFLAVNNYSKKCATEKTPERYIIRPMNFIDGRWQEFVEYSPAKDWRQKLKEEKEKSRKAKEASQ